jgi:hypothetical protein
MVAVSIIRETIIASERFGFEDIVPPWKLIVRP